MASFVDDEAGPRNDSKRELSDADGYPRDLEIPIRYIKGMGGDMKEARRRWVETLKWRESYRVDGILQEPQTHFDVIKTYYPHFVYNRAKNGCLVYYELVGRINLPKLRENGVDLEGLIRHYIYITEFIWESLDTNEEAKLLTCMDLKGVTMSDFVGDAKTFMVRAAKLIAAHYPERSYKIFVLNAPWWFNVIWKVLSPLMHPNTRAKVTVCGSRYLDQLKELVDSEKIPAAIGGNDATPYDHSREEIVLREHVQQGLAAVRSGNGDGGNGTVATVSPATVSPVALKGPAAEAGLQHGIAVTAET